METEDVKPSDSFLLIHKVLTVTGFAKLRTIPKYKFMGYLFSIYRVVVFALCVLFIFQHLAYLPQVYKDQDKLAECLLIILPQFNMMAKLLTGIWYGNRLENLQELMDSPIFASKNERDRKLLQKNQDFINKFVKILLISVCLTVTAWIMSTFLNRMNDSTFTIPIYVPFNTNSTKGFLLSAFFEQVPVLWIDFGHFTSDCLIISYYSQTIVQIKIIRQNLEHLTDSEYSDILRDYYSSKNNHPYRYIDGVDENIKERFQYYIRRHVKLIWFANEVHEIFENAIKVQMFTTSALLCLCVYQLSTGKNEIIFIAFYVGYLFILQTQIFVFCFCGELVKYETELVVDSVYLCDWYNLSPGFRKQLLIGMIRWTVPIDLKMSQVVPLSLTTFFMIGRFAFNLLAFLKNSNENTSN